jgi:phosphoglucosamine mutase
VLAALKRSGKTLAELLDGVSLFPQKLINVRMKAGADWKNSEAIRSAVEQAEHSLESRGRVLIRASGTEPVLRVMVEAAAQADAVRHAETIAQVVKDVTS